MVLPDIKSQTREALAARLAEWRLPAYRLDQLLHWLYVRRVTGWEAMTNLPRELRDRLREHYTLQAIELVTKQGSRDTTQKFLWRLADQSFIESVLIPANPALFVSPLRSAARTDANSAPAGLKVGNGISNRTKSSSRSSPSSETLPLIPIGL